MIRGKGYKLTSRQRAIKRALRKILSESNGKFKSKALGILKAILSWKERKVLIFLYTPGEGEKRTLKEAGKKILGRKHDRESPRQMEVRALRRLEKALELNELISSEEIRRLEEFDEEKQALWEIFKKCSPHWFYRVRWERYKRISKAGITLSDLKTLSEEETIKKIKIRKGTKIEKCLREMWQMVNSQNSQT